MSPTFVLLAGILKRLRLFIVVVFVLVIF